MPAHSLTADEAVAALELIATGTVAEKLRFIAQHDADLFVDHVLEWRVSYADRDVTSPTPAPTDAAALDAFIARLAIGVPATQTAAA